MLPCRHVSRRTLTENTLSLRCHTAKLHMGSLWTIITLAISIWYRWGAVNCLQAAATQ